MKGPKITAFCPTLNRPELLGRMIACFEHQTYPNRELIILDDSGQYEHQSGDRWQLISIPRRIRTLGEKNNAAVAMAAFDSGAVAKADDDDIYMPWWLESIAEALGRGAELIQPRWAVDFVDGRWVRIETFSRAPGVHSFAYHGCWAYSRRLFDSVGGYRAEYAGDDQELDRRLHALGVESVGLDETRYQPFYWYNRPLPGRLSERGGSREAYESTPIGPYVGKVPAWEGEPVWERAIPQDRIRRGW